MSWQLFAPLLGLLITFFASAQDNLPLKVEDITRFDEPWSMAFLPAGRAMPSRQASLPRP
ncbi:hypothetical protein VT06_01675 [Arsukibacterium sp. MJ3]|uniref:hypothetical protein n=1 Tax=Arsukibacterium sp. MJ3 TaxID=1632859 RepID=UPI000626F449|nr:hypothetical protein [Arsukibacterium sp. MJ3]KKO50193.1 hypothetical protein VT06_01675 [Arsukibacterium sp. MJ3]